MITACSATSAAAQEHLIGSAPEASGWVCLEQAGPWGAKAWTDSHLDPGVGAAVESAAAAHGVRPSLIRRPGPHADAHVGGPRRVLVAHSRPRAAWLLSGTVESPEELLGLDWAAVSAGDRDAVLESLPSLSPSEPQLLVCTNGTRDTCCARLGRPVAAAAAARFPDRVWEVTHTSGHRFAPTTVLLPSGSLHGRVLDAGPLLARRVPRAARARRLSRPLGLAGGRAGRRVPRSRAARDHRPRRPAVDGPTDDGWEVAHRDGRRWRCTSRIYEEGERPESCGKDAKPVTRYAATAGRTEALDRCARRHREAGRRCTNLGRVSADFDDLLAANREFARDFGLWPGSTASPTPGIALVTCMDSRIDPLGMLGLSPATPRSSATPVAGSPSRPSRRSCSASTCSTSSGSSWCRTPGARWPPHRGAAPARRSAPRPARTPPGTLPRRREPAGGARARRAQGPLAPADPRRRGGRRVRLRRRHRPARAAALIRPGGPGLEQALDQHRWPVTSSLRRRSCPGRPRRRRPR